jgi:hypothetical protein
MEIFGYRDLIVMMGRAHKDLRSSNERKAYAAALIAFTQFGKANGWNAAILVWLAELASALTDLDDGIVAPLLEPALKSKSFSSNTWRRFALVALGMKALTMSGVKRNEAADRALRTVKMIRGAPRKTILSRYDDFQRGRIKNKEAVRVFTKDALRGKARSNPDRLARLYFALADLEA